MKWFDDLPSGFQLFAGGEEHAQQARDYISAHGLTPEQVRLVQRVDGDIKMILVVKR